MTESFATARPPPRPLIVGAPQLGALFHVVLQHEYNHNDQPCWRYLELSPTARTEQTLRRTGLLVRLDPGGFSIFYRSARSDRLERGLRADTPTHESPVDLDANQLCFHLTAREYSLAEATALPLNSGPLDQIFYVSNTRATGTAARAKFVPHTMLGDEDAFPVHAVPFSAFIPAGGKAVLRDADGSIVQTTLSNRDAAHEIDPAALSEGLNTLEITDAHGEPLQPPATFVHAMARPTSLCFIRLALARPAGVPLGIYPVEPSAAPTERGPGDGGLVERITPVTYVLQLPARRTRWVYYVVLRSFVPPATARLVVERAEHSDTDPTIAFDGPDLAALPNGDRAHRFISRGPILLQHRSQAHLQLVLHSQRHGGATERRVLVDWLPVASADQVRRRTLIPPHSGCAETDRFSDIHVVV